MRTKVLKILNLILKMESEKIPNGNKAFINCKCPRCRRGRVFYYPLYRIDKLLSTYERCPVCDVKYEQETGFFWTAMYISYGLSTGLVLFVGLLMIGLDLPLFKDWRYFTSLIAIFIVFIPFSFRYSRMLTIYLIAPYRKYNPKYKTEKFVNRRDG